MQLLCAGAVRFSLTYADDLLPEHARRVYKRVPKATNDLLLGIIFITCVRFYTHHTISICCTVAHLPVWRSCAPRSVSSTKPLNTADQLLYRLSVVVFVYRLRMVSTKGANLTSPSTKGFLCLSFSRVYVTLVRLSFLRGGFKPPDNHDNPS